MVSVEWSVLLYLMRFSLDNLHSQQETFRPDVGCDLKLWCVLMKSRSIEIDKVA